METAEMVVVGPGYGPPAPVPVYQWAAEFEKLLDIYKKEAPMGVLEIGSYSGGTLYHWLQNAAAGCHVVSLDLEAPNQHLYGDWIPDGVTLDVYLADSRARVTVDQVRRVYAPFDWVFIDGDHTYEGVRNDWENYRPMVNPGGIVAFHDILPPSRSWPEIEVNWLWKEIKAFGWDATEIVADYNAEWGGIGLVRVP